MSLKDMENFSIRCKEQNEMSGSVSTIFRYMKVAANAQKMIFLKVGLKKPTSINLNTRFTKIFTKNTI